MHRRYRTNITDGTSPSELRVYNRKTDWANSHAEKETIENRKTQEAGFPK
jgi:hypothetical protein